MQQRTTFYRQYGKRLFDLVVAVPLLIVLTPLMLITALAIRFSLGRPILFRQPRPGREGRLFEMIKFRTMREAYDTQNNSLPDSARLTKLGKWLRATSIDELPELWNVIRGEMSIVGPRPLLVEYLSLYTADQMRRHDMIPGLTGWSQIHGRNDLGWGEKFEHDLWYVNNCNFVLDLKILAITIGKVLSRHGVSQIGHATTEKFNGENQLSLHLRDSEKRVTVLGAGGHAKVVVSMLRALGYEIAGIYDDAPELLGIQIYGIEVRDRIVNCTLGWRSR